MTWEHAVSVIILFQLTIKDVIQKRPFWKKTGLEGTVMVVWSRWPRESTQSLKLQLVSFGGEQHVAAEL